MGNFLLPSALILTHTLLVFFAWKGICREDSDRAKFLRGDHHLKIRCKKTWIEKIRSGAVRIIPRKKSPEIASLIPGDLILFYEGNVSVYARVERITEYSDSDSPGTLRGISLAGSSDARFAREQSAPEKDLLALYIDADI